MEKLRTLFKNFEVNILYITKILPHLILVQICIVLEEYSRSFSFYKFIKRFFFFLISFSVPSNRQHFRAVDKLGRRPECLSLAAAKPRPRPLHLRADAPALPEDTQGPGLWSVYQAKTGSIPV